MQSSDNLIINHLKNLKPDLEFEFISDPFSPYDVLATKDGKPYAFIELKSRTADKCKYVRRDNSLLVDWHKVSSLASQSKENGIPSILVQFLEDKNELTILKVAEEDGTITTKLKKKTIHANASTRSSYTQSTNGMRAQKEMCFYSLSDCWKKVF